VNDIHVNPHRLDGLSLSSVAADARGQGLAVKATSRPVWLRVLTGDLGPEVGIEHGGAMTSEQMRAAMALAYDATRVTRDIDATFVPHGVVIEEARRVADDLGLPYWWLNEQASIYISGKDDPGKRRVFDHPGLRVAAASSAHIFAMKALAARTRDIDDLRVLVDIIGVQSSPGPPWVHRKQIGHC
jgi:hypothetical protein